MPITSIDRSDRAALILTEQEKPNKIDNKLRNLASILDSVKTSPTNKNLRELNKTIINLKNESPSISLEMSNQLYETAQKLDTYAQKQIAKEKKSIIPNFLRRWWQNFRGLGKSTKSEFAGNIKNELDSLHPKPPKIDQKFWNQAADKIQGASEEEIKKYIQNQGIVKVFNENLDDSLNSYEQLSKKPDEIKKFFKILINEAFSQLDEQKKGVALQHQTVEEALGHNRFGKEFWMDLPQELMDQNDTKLKKYINENKMVKIFLDNPEKMATTFENAQSERESSTRERLFNFIVEEAIKELGGKEKLMELSPNHPSIRSAVSND